MNSRFPERKLTITLIIGMFLCLTLPIGDLRGQSKPSDADSAAIKQVFAKFDESFNRHDAQDTSVFTDDADFTNMRGRTKAAERGLLSG